MASARPGPGRSSGRVREAIGPAVEAAKAVLGEGEGNPAGDGIEVKFGVKASGEASWLVAKAAAEGNFEVTLTWSRRESTRSACEEDEAPESDTETVGS